MQLLSTARGACLILALITVCGAALNANEKEDSNAVVTREKRTYRHYAARNCGKPGYPHHGWSLYSKTTTGGRVIHACKAGYLLVGAKLRICQSNGRWTPSLPRCQLINCGDPDDLANGLRWFRTTTLGSFVKYKCNSGYKMVGYQYRKCLSSGAWSGRAPTCRALGCPALGSPHNGNVKVSQGSSGPTAAYSCNHGFILKGSATRACVNGVWQAEAPVCQVIDCGHLKAPKNGEVHFKSTAYAAKAYYQCNKGYTRHGTEVRFCQANGEWSGTAPTCNGVECPALRDIAHGSVAVKRRGRDFTATYTCDAGYFLQGNKHRKCRAGSQWLGHEPSCQVTLCPVLLSPANGGVSVSHRTVGSQANYYCNRGYRLEGSLSRTCLSGGSWSSQAPICVVVQCARLKAPTNGKVIVFGRQVGSRAEYSCKQGYVLRGEKTRLCQSSGLWTNEPPVCTALQCSVLSSPQHGTVSVSGQDPGSMARYSCLPGYVLQGVVIRTCQTTGIWSFEAPVCVGITCLNLQDPANGEVRMTGNTPSSTATYVCDSGYELVGVQSRVCQINGQWTGRAPVCRASLCPALTAPSNGRVTVVTHTVDSVAIYSCNAGFTLQGTSTRTCINQGEGVMGWTGQEPRCVPIRCPRLSSPTNGRVEALQRTPGSVASYSCNDGYTLRGAQSRLCRSSGQWSGQEPVCVVVDCGRLSDILNGRVQVSTTTFGSTATYVCDPGYSVVGTAVRSCLAVGVWSGREPSCTTSTCAPLDDPANGQVTISGSSIGATARYTCNRGYVLRGLINRVCLPNRQWSGTAPPTCEARTCPNLIAPRNGNIVVSGLVFSSTAIYSCNHGYTLVGVASRTCQDDGSWSGIAPFCQVVQCGRLEFPDNGQVRQVGTQLGATGTYSCFPGYRLRGDETRLCQKSGVWSGAPPTCEPIDCGELPEIAFGSVTFTTTTFASQASYSCLQGYVLVGLVLRTCQADSTWSGQDPTCQIFTCNSLDDPANGQVVTTGFEEGDTATYVCQGGFSLQGVNMRRCMRNGVWSDSPPVCVGVTCPLLIAPDNGQVLIQGFSVGLTAQYSCFPGFVLQGSRNRSCLSSGSWSGSDPVCISVDCPDLRDPVRGEVTLSGNAFGSTATYRCEVGYGLVGVAVRVCQANGAWSDNAPICQISVCSTLEAPQNGNIVTTSTQFGGQATYSCVEGYRLVGTATRVCQSSGFWSGSAPFCSIVTCPLLDPPKDGRVNFVSTSFGAEARYTCFPGYRREGVVVRTCLANGVWSPAEPSCQRIDCGILVAPKNGDIGFSQGTLFRSVATYSCDSPFHLMGVVTRVCQSNGEWSEEAPTCESLFCEELVNPDNGLVVMPSRLPGSTATYMCNQGYNLIGSRTRSCQNNGFWSGVHPLCQFSDCGSLKPPRHGDVELSGTTIGSVADYECFDGYVLEGDVRRSCADGGVWTGKEPVCNPVTCGSLANIPDGYVEVDGATFGSTASYACNSGFVLRGKGLRQCSESGAWSGHEPVCEEVDCGGLQGPANGDVVLSGTSFGFTATYSCGQGYTAIGFLTRICQATGEWSGDTPTCVANECPNLNNPTRGTISLTGQQYLDTATYHCNQGYVLSGGNIRTCQLNGVWSGTAPDCISVDCGQPPQLQNGLYQLVTGTARGAQVSYSCQRGYQLVGSDSRTCLSSGTWSREAISCQTVDCGSLHISNGTVSYAGSQVGGQARYSCNTGFNLVGVEVRICQENGQWSSHPPSCAPIQAFTCNQLSAPANGQVSLSGFAAGSLANYSCNSGYFMVGGAYRRCVDHHGWTGSAPLCQRVDCGVLEPPINGRVMTLGTTVDSVALYNCDEGNVLLGAVTRSCGAGGRWSNSEPTCAAVECGRLPNPANGHVSLTDVVLGSVATYTCQTGFSLRGSTTRRCARTGHWTGVAPSCESSAPDTCGDPGTPVSGTKIGNDYRIGATVYYECDSGYRLDGTGSRQCQQSGIWTGDLPQCIEQLCEEGSTAYDECQRRCTCRGGALVECCRVRYDFAALTVADRQRYIQAVLTVASEAPYKQKYDALVAQYLASFDSLAQSSDPAVSQFFPWNRYFLIQYENLLQEVDCRVTIPYWDWTILPVSPYLAQVWSPDSGFGDSSRTKDGCVENGPFRFDLFNVTPSGGGGCLRRNYRMQMFPTRSNVEQDLLTLPASEYGEFYRFLQIFIHTNVRCFVGGHMCSDNAANDPAYLLHLAQIDVIFSRWQAIDADRFSTVAGDARQLELTGNVDYVVSDFGDINDLPGGNRVCYESSEFKDHVPPSMQFLTNSLQQMTDNGNVHMTCITEEEMAHVKMTSDAADFMHKMCDDVTSK